MFIHLFAEATGLLFINSFINLFPEPFYVPGIVLEAEFSKGEVCSSHPGRLGSPNRVFIEFTFRVQETPNFVK